MNRCALHATYSTKGGVLAVLDITVLDRIAVSLQFLHCLSREHNIGRHHCRPIFNQYTLARRCLAVDNEWRRETEKVFCQAFETLRPHIPKKKGSQFPETCESCKKKWNDHGGEI